MSASTVLPRAGSAATLVFFWSLMVLLGAVALETFMFYPNIFHDVPRSLDVAMDFMVVAAPNTFFPPLGFVCWCSGAIAVALCWRTPARNWLAAALASTLADGVFSQVFNWPRNDILFNEGSRVHPPEVLIQTAEEFQALHWARVAFTVAAAAFVFVAVLRLHASRTRFGSSEPVQAPSST